MSQYTRNPYPKKIVWKQDDVMHKQFYWLEQKGDQVKRSETIARYNDQTVIIEKLDNKSLTINLNDKMMDLDQQVIIKYGETTKTYTPKRTIAAMIENFEAYKDDDYLFPVKLNFEK